MRADQYWHESAPGAPIFDASDAYYHRIRQDGDRANIRPTVSDRGSAAGLLGFLDVQVYSK